MFVVVYSVDSEVEWLQSIAVTTPHNHQAVLYCTIVLLLRCIYNYTKHVNPMLIDSRLTMPLWADSASDVGS
jgi:hypothetical protein